MPHNQTKFCGMKIKFLIRKSAKRNDFETSASISIRVQDSDRYDETVVTPLSINPHFWDKDSFCVKQNALCPEKVIVETNKRLSDLENFVSRTFLEQKNHEKGWLTEKVDMFFHPERYKEALPEEATFQDMCKKFVNLHTFSESRKKHFRVLMEVMRRYEKYVAITTKNNNFRLYAENVTTETILEIKDYITNEYKYVAVYPQLLEVTPEAKPIGVRSENTVIDYLCRLRAFFMWCFKYKLLTNRPFDQIHIEECVYGTPVILTQEERDHLAAFDLSSRPQLEVQRDIFIFQCLIGCRVSDLYSLTKDNIIGESIHYIQKKTKNENPRTVVVPLVDEAKQLIKKYEGRSDKLFPYIASQKYNEDLKVIFKLAELNRVVTVLNPQGRMPESKPLHELACSHLARRTFVGIMYKNCPNKSIIASMSGHNENSRAFSRYKKIDEEMQREFMEKNLVKR